MQGRTSFFTIGISISDDVIAALVNCIGLKPDFYSLISESRPYCALIRIIANQVKEIIVQVKADAHCSNVERRKKIVDIMPLYLTTASRFNDALKQKNKTCQGGKTNHNEGHECRVALVRIRWVAGRRNENHRGQRSVVRRTYPCSYHQRSYYTKSAAVLAFFRKAHDRKRGGGARNGDEKRKGEQSGPISRLPVYQHRLPVEVIGKACCDPKDQGSQQDASGRRTTS